MTRSDELGRGNRPANVAFVAMAHHQLGHDEQARAAIVRLRELVQIPANADDADIRAFVDEADALLAGSGTSN